MSVDKSTMNLEICEVGWVDMVWCLRVESEVVVRGIGCGFNAAPGRNNSVHIGALNRFPCVSKVVSLVKYVPITTSAVFRRL